MNLFLGHSPLHAKRYLHDLHCEGMQQFAGYALVVTFVIWTIDGLMPDFAIVGWIFQFYIVYVVWEGVPVLLKIDEKRRFKFTILSSLLLLICPILIEFVFNKLTMILN